MSNKNILLVILGLSLATHFAFFGHPAQTVFDEVHFGKFISGYYTHEYFFDIHPPLGKLLIAGFGKLFDFRPEFSFAQIGDRFPDSKYIALRFLPSFAGALLPVIIFLLALELGLSRWTSATAALMVLLDNAILVQSRFILLDAFLLLFGFSALLCYFKFRNKGDYKYLMMAGVLSGLAFSIKWTGIAFPGLAGIIELIDLVRTRRLRRFAHSTGWLTVAPFLIYFTIFAMHFSLLYKSGPGNAFMTPAFQKTLQNNPIEKTSNAEPLGLFQKFTELNVQMYTANQGLTAVHSYSSPWYSWPLMSRPIYYWVESSNPSDVARIYFLGNPAVWWLSAAAVMSIILYAIRRLGLIGETGWFLLAGYFLNLLPFIGVQRVMFLYHYMPALIFAILIFGYHLEQLRKDSPRLLAGICSLVIICFAFFAPLTYGLGLTPEQYDLRNWLQSWI